ncbi:hypothetical protein KSP39_PZI002326 [Platanthera zijinensis]|uniref:Transposase (putative) gypsy type domain-containing protein n=1 Tax=Platanthera zijinensis TaxID=2320716 RepID=A0AAP0BY60_9ASPA
MLTFTNTIPILLQDTYVSPRLQNVPLPLSWKLKASMPGESEGRSKCAQTFLNHNSPLPCRLTQAEFLTITKNFISSGFVARNPRNDDRVNLTPEGELEIPFEHFEVGFCLPLWPEVRQTLRYYGLVPAQLNPNSITLLVAFTCNMRAERIEFSLPIFWKLFNFQAKGGSVFLSGQSVKTAGLANKHHHWAERIFFVLGPFGNIPLAPILYDETTYKPPALGEREGALVELFGSKVFDVPFLRRDQIPSYRYLPTKVLFRSNLATFRFKV